MTCADYIIAAAHTKSKIARRVRSNRSFMNNFLGRWFAMRHRSGRSSCGILASIIACNALAGVACEPYRFALSSRKRFEFLSEPHSPDTSTIRNLPRNRGNASSCKIWQTTIAMPTRGTMGAWPVAALRLCDSDMAIKKLQYGSGGSPGYHLVCPAIQAKTYHRFPAAHGREITNECAI